MDFRRPAEAKTVPAVEPRIHEYAHPEHRLAAVAKDYSARPDRTVAIVSDPSERRELTQLIRSDLQAQGKLSGDSRSVPVLVEQSIGNPKVAATTE